MGDVFAFRGGGLSGLPLFLYFYANQKQGTMRVLFPLLLLSLSGCTPTVETDKATEVIAEHIKSIANDPSSVQDVEVLQIDTFYLVGSLRRSVSQFAFSEKFNKDKFDQGAGEDYLVKAEASRKSLDSLNAILLKTDTTIIEEFLYTGQYRANNKLGALVVGKFEYFLDVEVSGVLR